MPKEVERMPQSHARHDSKQRPDAVVPLVGSEDEVAPPPPDFAEFIAQPRRIAEQDWILLHIERWLVMKRSK